MRSASCVAILAWIMASPASSAEPAVRPAPRNVTDYFLALPQDALGVGGPSPTERRRLIDTEDLKNGYLHLSSGDWEGHGEVVLWRKPDKSYLLGLSIAHCGPVCGQHLKFFVLRDGELAEVTDQVWTWLSDEDVTARYEKIAKKKYAEGEVPPTLVKLPRQGTAVKLVTQEAFTDNEYLLASWSFKDGKFVLQPAP